MNHYELLYLIPATFSDEELKPLKNKIKELIAKQEGKITLEDNLGKKKLAYPIQHVRHGHYLLYEFDLPGEAVKELDRDLKLTPEILRHQIARKTTKTPSMIEITEKKVKQEKEKEEKKTKPDDRDKIKLEDLDKKLDEILEGDIL